MAGSTLEMHTLVISPCPFAYIYRSRHFVAAHRPVTSSKSPRGLKPSHGHFPKTGDDTISGGIFGISVPDLDAYINRTGADPTYTGSESPLTLGNPTSGTGPYPAELKIDSSLPNHTIYAPITPPNVTLPFIAWGNGACTSDGSTYQNILLEIASYGYLIVADGPPGGLGPGVQTVVSDMRESLDWVTNGGASAYGNVDTERIATTGQSCGGLEALATAYRDPRVKQILMFNIGIFQDEKRYLLQMFNIPIAWFVGGPGDLGYIGAEKDYHKLNRGLPALIANLDTGHGRTYGATNGGKFGGAAVQYLEWQFRDDVSSRAVFLNPHSEGSLVSENWNVESKNWPRRRV